MQSGVCTVLYVVECQVWWRVMGTLEIERSEVTSSLSDCIQVTKFLCAGTLVTTITISTVHAAVKSM